MLVFLNESCYCLFALQTNLTGWPSFVEAPNSRTPLSLLSGGGGWSCWRYRAASSSARPPSPRYGAGHDRLPTRQCRPLPPPPAETARRPPRGPTPRYPLSRCSSPDRPWATNIGPTASVATDATGLPRHDGTTEQDCAVGFREESDRRGSAICLHRRPETAGESHERHATFLENNPNIINCFALISVTIHKVSSFLVNSLVSFFLMTLQ